MFLEVSGASYEKLKPFLQEKGYSYEISDCTMPGDTQTFVHLEFNGQTELTEVQIKEIADQVDLAYRELAAESLAKEKRERE